MTEAQKELEQILLKHIKDVQKGNAAYDKGNIPQTANILIKLWEFTGK